MYTLPPCSCKRIEVDTNTSHSSTMAATGKTVIAFDLYGTLLSTESIAKELATHFGQEKAASLAALWRRYQLEYTWRLNSMSMPIRVENISSDSHTLMDPKDNISPSPTSLATRLVMLWQTLVFPWMMNRSSI